MQCEKDMYSKYRIFVIQFLQYNGRVRNGDGGKSSRFPTSFVIYSPVVLVGWGWGDDGVFSFFFRVIDGESAKYKEN